MLVYQILKLHTLHILLKKLSGKEIGSMLEEKTYKGTLEHPNMHPNMDDTVISTPSVMKLIENLKPYKAVGPFKINPLV